MASPPQKVSLYSSNDLKNATDDALAPYLTTLPKPFHFKQQHYTTNIKLALGYTAVLIAGVLFYADWKLGWDATKVYTGPACVVYFLLNGVLTYWIWAVEAGTVFTGVREGGQKLTLRSSAQKHSPDYKLKVTYAAPSGKTWQDEEITGKFTEWFNTHGFLQKKDFQQWLDRNIGVLNIAREELDRKEKTAERVPVLMPTTRADEMSTSATGIEAASSVPSSAKKGRPKKKA